MMDASPESTTHSARTWQDEIVKCGVVLLLALLATLTIHAGSVLAQGNPTLVIGNAGPVAGGTNVDVPITYTRGTLQTSVFIFSIDYDEACLTYTGRTFSPNIPASFALSGSHTLADTDGELDVAVYSLLLNPPPVLPNATDVLLTIHFTTKCTPAPGGHVIAPVIYSTSPNPSFSTSGATAVTVNLTPGSVLIATELVTVTPTTPTFNTITACNTYGSITWPSNPSGYTYARTSGNGQTGMNTVTATALPGFIFSGAQTTMTWTENLGSYFLCEATPTAPTFHPIVVCNTWGSVDIPNITGVIYTRTVGDGQQGAIKIEATAASGYILVGANLGPWNADLGTLTTCATPTAPTFHPIVACNTWGSVDIPGITGVVYTRTVGDGQQGAIKIVATAAAGYMLVGADLGPWEADLGTRTTCATPVEPTITPITACNQYGIVDFATTPGVTYTLSPDGAVEGPIVVSAAAQAGYTLAGYTGPWHYDLGVFVACPPGEIEVTPEAPTAVTIAGCGVAGHIDLPVVTGVIYTASPSNATEGIVWVYAAADTGYVLVNYTGPWKYNLGTFEECPIPVTPVRPTVAPINACGVYAEVVLATTPGVTYSMTPAVAQEGIVVITAAARAGYILEDYDGPWQYDLGTYHDCFIPVVPVQPIVTPINGCGVYGQVELMMTLGVDYTMTPADAKEGIVYVSAVATMGYILKDYDGPWQYDLGSYEACVSLIAVTPVEPTISLAGEDTYGSVVFAETEGILYTMDPADAREGIVIVAATPLPGYVLENYAGPWVYDLGIYISTQGLPSQIFLPTVQGKPR